MSINFAIDFAFFFVSPDSPTERGWLLSTKLECLICKNVHDWLHIKAVKIITSSATSDEMLKWHFSFNENSMIIIPMWFNGSWVFCAMTRVRTSEPKMSMLGSDMWRYMDSYSISFTKMHLKMSSAKWRLFRLCLNVFKLSGLILSVDKDSCLIGLFGIHFEVFNLGHLSPSEAILSRQTLLHRNSSDNCSQVHRACQDTGNMGARFTERTRSPSNVRTEQVCYKSHI